MQNKEADDEELMCETRYGCSKCGSAELFVATSSAGGTARLFLCASVQMS